ncbi:hypothetical protein N9W79_00800 [bacterium]|nr:hypothetical protein [bacterium]
MEFISKILILSFVSFGCSTEIPKGTSLLNFYLDRDGTTDGIIYLNLEVPEGESYELGFSSDDPTLSFVVPEGSSLPITEETVNVPIFSSQKGLHQFSINIYTSDGMAIVSDQFSFVHQFGFLAPPSITFSEKASKDGVVTLQISAARDYKIDQIWVTGDVDPAYSARWIDINVLDQVDLKLTAGTGEKTVVAKVRDTLGAESDPQTLNISVDTDNPSGCMVEFASDVVNAPFVNVRLSGIDNTNMKYGVSGDVGALLDDIDFTEGESFYVQLSLGEGVKNLFFSLSDYAENFCLLETKTVTVDESHNPIEVFIAGNPIYTYSRTVDISFRIDAFDLNSFQIYVAGGVIDDDDTHEWIPYQNTVNTLLEAGEGMRIVYFKILDAGGESQYVADSVYLNPTLRLTPGATYQVHLPNILEATGITILGCVETYIDVPHQQSFPCTPAAASVAATIDFSDGSSLSLGENF